MLAGLKELHMAEIIQSGFNRNSSETRPQRTTRRDAPVKCASCGRQVKRRGRGQLYCSARCRKRAHYAESVRRGDFSSPLVSDTALGTIPLKKAKKFKALQRAKPLSSRGISGPAHVLAVEVFGRTWKSTISSSGVPVEIGRLRARALVAS
jgi:hypothetical protein